MRNKVVALLVLASVVGCAQGTFVTLSLQQTVTAPPTAKIELALSLGGKSATTTLSAPGGKAITFPATASLQIDSGSGAMIVTATAYGATGAIIDHASASIEVLAGKNVPFSLSLGGVVPGAPSAPQNVMASSGNAQATVTWTAPASTGSSAISSYTVTSAPGGIEVTTAAGNTNANITGLTNGTTYTFSVAATNATGIGPAAQSNPVTPSATPMDPGAPTNVTAAANIDHGATVSWTAPSTTGSAPITSYTVTASPGGATATTSDGNTTSAQVTGLTPGTSYQFTVFATNKVGPGPASISLSSVVVLGKLAAPTSVTACGANGQINVTFNAVASAQSYDVFYSGSAPATGGSKVNVAGSPALITVPNGSYHLAVTAVNGLGDGTASADVTALADTQIHDTLFVSGTNSWSAFDCFSQIPDGTSVPTRKVTGTFAAGIAVDRVNAVVWVGGGPGILGYADATRANGSVSASYSMTVASSIYDIAVDSAHQKLYVMTDCAGACGNPTYPLFRFGYVAPSDLNTTTPMSEASFTTPTASGTGAPSEFFVNEATGDLWAAFVSAGGEGEVAFYAVANNLADGSSTTKSFTLSAGATDYPASVAYASASGGTLYTSWAIGSGASVATDYVTGIDSAAGGQVNSSGTVTSSKGLLAIGNSMLIVSTSNGIQAWNLTTPSGNPIKTVTAPDAGNGLYYVP